MRKYYTTFNMEDRTIGFALAIKVSTWWHQWVWVLLFLMVVICVFLFYKYKRRSTQAGEQPRDYTGLQALNGSADAIEPLQLSEEEKERVRSVRLEKFGVEMVDVKLDGAGEGLGEGM